ncbi:hypothetical protein PG994_008115 [Apiospora phragmitis]|uniref:Fungal N-terminal domain-containing protein n=1 Tax=Apiospora phragmitis TaxID=2905665 RepID=A0ABR1US45_9PEZI
MEFAASVLTLVGTANATIQGLNRIRKSWKEAPAETKATHDQLNLFLGFIDASCAHIQETADPNLILAVTNTQRVVEELKSLVDVDLLGREQEVSDKKIRLAWLGHKSAAIQIRTNLSDAQARLGLALTLPLTSRLDRRFSDIKQALVAAQIPPNPEPGTTSSGTEMIEDSELRRKDQRFANFVCELSSAAKQPPNAFKRSPTFLPETYTADDSGRLGYIRRQYFSVEAQLLVTIESPYWDILRAKPAGSSLHTALSLPFTLENALVGFLRTCEVPDQGGHVHVHLGQQPSGLAFKQLLEPKSDVDRRLRHITAAARYLDCPRYRGRELIHQNLCTQGMVMPQFIAWLDSRWVMESRFSMDADDIDECWYTFQVLHCMRSHPVYSSLVGLVESDDGGLLVYLCEIPAGGQPPGPTSCSQQSWYACELVASTAMVPPPD